MLLNNVPPASLVEELVLRVGKMLRKELLGLLNHIVGHHDSHQMLLQDVLKPKEEHFLELTSPTFKVGKDKLSS